MPENRRTLYFRNIGLKACKDDIRTKVQFKSALEDFDLGLYKFIFQLTFTATMKILFWSIGKAHESYVKEGIDLFTKRINHYYTAEWYLLPMPKNTGMLSESDLKLKEGNMIMEWLKPDDYLVALDERGKQMKSEALASFIQARSNQSVRQLIFLIGGAYGLDEQVLKRANYKWSLSDLVFPHQLVRLMLAEQIYRACTILRNEKYHHA